MSFKKGDKVKYLPLHDQFKYYKLDETKEYTIQDPPGFGSQLIRLEEERGWWDVNMFTKVEHTSNDHSTHEVVTNSIFDKTFKYCRNCKVEVD